MAKLSDIQILMNISSLSSEYLLSKYELRKAEKLLISCFYQYICERDYIKKNKLYDASIKYNEEAFDFYNMLKAYLTANDVQYSTIKSFFIPEDMYPVSNDAILNLLIIDDTKESSIFQVGTGVGNFLSAASIKNEKLKLYGSDENAENIDITKMAISIMKKENLDSNITSNNYVFDFADKFFDYAFAYLSKSNKRVYESINVKNWININNVISIMNPEKFRFVCVVDNDALDLYDEVIRKIYDYIISNHYLEAILKYGAGENEKNKYVLIFSKGYGSNEEIKVGGNDFCKDVFFDDKVFVKKYLSNQDLKSYPANEFNKLNNINPDNIDDSVFKECLTIGSVFNIIRGSQYTKGRYDIDEEKTSEYCILSRTDLDDLDFDDLKHVFFKKEDKNEDIFIHKGDVLIKSRYTEFKCVYVLDEPKYKVIPIEGIVILRLKEGFENVYDPVFLSMFLLSQDGRAEISKIELVDVFHLLSVRDFKNIKLPDLSIQEQKMKSAGYLALLELKNLFYTKYKEVQKQLDEYQDIKFDKE